MCDVLSVRQKEPRGLGHAVLCAKPLIGDEPFAVCLGDEIFAPWGLGAKRGLKLLVETAQKMESSVIGVLPVEKSETVHYGIIDTQGKAFNDKKDPLQVVCTIEKPKPEKAPSNLAVIGRYVFTPEILDILENVKPSVGGEIQLTDAMDVLAAKGKLHAMLFDDNRYDVGNHLYYVLAQVDSSLHRPELAARLRVLLKQRLGLL